MTFPRLAEIQHYWDRYPPVHQLVAWYFGMGKDPKPKDPEADMAAFREELQAFNPQR